jgi:catechol 2,3-dioxygenase-like lactoylglutathione lyase family enzyme
VAARETTFVEIGPLTAFHRDTFATLLPFPALRMGWGLDAHWAAVARERGWPIGIVDATPVGHTIAPVGAGYGHDAAIAEARAAGATIARAPGETFWGGYSAIFIDPEGHPWEVAHNPRWTVHDDGSVSLG